MKVFLFIMLAFACSQGFAADCTLSVARQFNMPMGKAEVSKDALQVLKARGYAAKLVGNRAEGMLRGDLFVEVFARCDRSFFNMFMTTCSAHAVMTKFSVLDDIASASSPEVTRLGEYQVDVAGAFAKLPRCRELPRH